MVRIAEGASLFATRDVLVMSASVEPSGLRVVHVAVGDEADDARPLAPGEAPSLESSEAFSEWVRCLGTPGALPNVYLPDAPRLSRLDGEGGLFGGPAVDEASRRYLTLAVDARALRIRARVLQWLAARSVVDAAGTLRWASLGCGPAFPLVGALMRAASVGARVCATFIDPRAEALDVSRLIAAAHGVDPGRHVFLSREDAVALAPLDPESQDLVDALGLLDGRDDAEVVAGLARAFALVRPGGSLVFSAMRADRPAAAPPGFAWPVGAPRTLEQIAALIAAAGIPVVDAMAHLPQDGTYAVVEVTRL